VASLNFIDKKQKYLKNTFRPALYCGHKIVFGFSTLFNPTGIISPRKLKSKKT